MPLSPGSITQKHHSKVIFKCWVHLTLAYAFPVFPKWFRHASGEYPHSLTPGQRARLPSTADLHAASDPEAAANQHPVTPSNTRELYHRPVPSQIFPCHLPTIPKSEATVSGEMEKKSPFPILLKSLMIMDSFQCH